MTELGIVTEVRLVQLLNALVPILVTELGIVMEVRLEQFSNAAVLIDVTVTGSVYDTRVFPIGYWINIVFE